MMTKFLQYLISTLCLLCSTVVLAQVELISMDRGREFGITVGDELIHRYTILSAEHMVLTESSLPVARELSYWLDLKQVNIEKEEQKNGTIYHLTLTYQTFYAPLDIRRLTTDEISIDFVNSQTEQGYTLLLPEWRFTMSPLKEIQPSGVGANGQAMKFMQDSVVPDSIAITAVKNRLLLASSLVLLASLLLIWLSGYLSFWQISPFLKAKKHIKRLVKDDVNNQDTLQACLMVLHQAINQRAGHIVFADKLALFLKEYPQFQHLNLELDAFLLHSRSVFFLGEAADSKLTKQWLSLCDKLAAADKVSLKP